MGTTTEPTTTTTSCADKCCDRVAFSTSYYSKHVGFISGVSVAGTGFNGGKKELNTAESVEACAAECDKASTCKSFHWRKIENRCNLKTVVVDVTTLWTGEPWHLSYVAHQKVSAE